jgi:hypothetical protein
LRDSNDNLIEALHLNNASNHGVSTNQKGVTTTNNTSTTTTQGALPGSAYLTSENKTLFDLHKKKLKRENHTH